MRRIGKTEAIMSLSPEAEFSVKVGSDPSKDEVIWFKTENPPFSDEELLAEVDRLKKEYESQEYSRKRKKEYPSIEECVHAILDDNLEALQIKRKAVKDKYPKPEAPNE